MSAGCKAAPKYQLLSIPRLLRLVSSFFFFYYIIYLSSIIRSGLKWSHTSYRIFRETLRGYWSVINGMYKKKKKKARTLFVCLLSSGLLWRQRFSQGAPRLHSKSHKGQTGEGFPPFMITHGSETSFFHPSFLPSFLLHYAALDEPPPLFCCLQGQIKKMRSDSQRKARTQHWPRET